jgi:excisionase family DNA binding protein
MDAQKDTGQSFVFNVTAAANLLGVSKTTMWTLINDGSIPCIRLSPQRVGVALKDLEQYIEEKREVRK